MKRAIVLAGVLVATAGGLLGAIPARADSINIGIQIGTPPPPPPIVVAAPPQVVLVPGTPVYYAPSLSVNYFVYSGRYYTFHNGLWFAAAVHNGPWTFVEAHRVPQPVLAVPVAYYKVPPGHMKKNAGPPEWAGKGHGKGPKHKGRGD